MWSKVTNLPHIAQNSGEVEVGELVAGNVEAIRPEQKRQSAPCGKMSVMAIFRQLTVATLVLVPAHSATKDQTHRRPNVSRIRVSTEEQRLRFCKSKDRAQGAVLALIRSDIMIEYGPVEIGGKTYICPVRSVSISRGRSVTLLTEWDESFRTYGPYATMLNDVAFEGYHIFRAKSRMLTDFNPTQEEKSVHPKSQ